jgi:hypothetical protein
MPLGVCHYNSTFPRNKHGMRILMTEWLHYVLLIVIQLTRSFNSCRNDHTN